MRGQLGFGGFMLLVVGLVTTIISWMDPDPNSFFVGFRWFGPVMMVFGVVLLALIAWMSD